MSRCEKGADQLLNWFVANKLTMMPDYCLVVFGCSNEASRAEGITLLQ